MGLAWTNHGWLVKVTLKMASYVPRLPHVNLQKTPEVFAELILGQPLFTGKDGVDQLVGVSVGWDLC